MEIINGEMAGSFDPAVVEAFTLCLTEITEVYDEFKEV